MALTQAVYTNTDPAKLTSEGINWPKAPATTESGEQLYYYAGDTGWQPATTQGAELPGFELYVGNVLEGEAPAPTPEPTPEPVTEPEPTPEPVETPAPVEPTEPEATPEPEPQAENTDEPVETPEEKKSDG
jgi:outer membrane biosynthesis protein TonB